METIRNLKGTGISVTGGGGISSLPSSMEKPNVSPGRTTLVLLRLLFSLFLVVIATSNPGSGAESGIINAVLWGYLFFSVVLAAGVLVQFEFADSLYRYSAWADFCCFASLVLLTKDTSPIQLMGFWLGILTCYHSSSRDASLKLTFMVITIVAADLCFRFGSTTFSLGLLGLEPRFARATVILTSAVLGSLTAYWKWQKSTLEDRVDLLLNISDSSNPRFGSEWSLNTLMERLGAFYQADCLLIDFLESDTGYRIHRQTSGPSGASLQTEILGMECASQFLVVAETRAFVLSSSRIPFLAQRYIETDVYSGIRTTKISRAVASLSVLLEAQSIVSVPVFREGKVTGRIFLSSKIKRRFSDEEPVFLSRLIGQSLQTIENLRLVDSLGKSASELERKHLALDMHDSVIQPFIGIHLGLNAIRRRVQAGQMDVSEDLEKLATLAELEITGFRRYVGKLAPEIGNGWQFLPAIQRLTEKFAATTGIAVEVKASKEIELNQKIAAEAFQMIAEGLSNIRRHTHASEATIEVDCDKRRFQLLISNNGRNGTSADFSPKSITTRVKLLGGEVLIDLDTPGKTTVKIGIPH